MRWEEKSVTLDNVDKKEFDTHLASVTVSENGITVEFKEVDDWHRIQREVGDEMILREVHWEDVEGVDTSEEHLYYPHINVQVEPEDEDDLLHERRLYFIEDETETMKRVRNAIRRYWNGYRQRTADHGGTYSYQERDAEDASEPVALEEAVGSEEAVDDDSEAGRASSPDASGEDAPVADEQPAATGGTEQTMEDAPPEPEDDSDEQDDIGAREAEDDAAPDQRPDGETEGGGDAAAEDDEASSGSDGRSAKDKLKKMAGMGSDREEETDDAADSKEDDEGEGDEDDDEGYVDDIVDGLMDE